MTRPPELADIPALIAAHWWSPALRESILQYIQQLEPVVLAARELVDAITDDTLEAIHQYDEDNGDIVSSKETALCKALEGMNG